VTAVGGTRAHQSLTAREIVGGNYCGAKHRQSTVNEARSMNSFFRVFREKRKETRCLTLLRHNKPIGTNLSFIVAGVFEPSWCFQEVQSSFDPITPQYTPLHHETFRKFAQTFRTFKTTHILI
jgi:hypothetical protein